MPLASDDDLDLNERRAKFKNYSIILCEKCKEQFYYNSYCKYCFDEKTASEKNRLRQKGCEKCFKESYGCISCRFQHDFDKWTSSNESIDKLIQESQISARDFFHILEWIPYDSFINIEHIAKGGFAKVYSATWMSGYIVDWKGFSDWKRSDPIKVALKVLNNSSKNISKDFLNEVYISKLYNK